MAIRGFSFIELRSIVGSLTVNPNSVSITAASLRAEARFVRTNVAVELAYDAPQRAFGFMAAMDQFGLQVLGGKGVKQSVRWGFRGPQSWMCLVCALLHLAKTAITGVVKDEIEATYASLKDSAGLAVMRSPLTRPLLVLLRACSRPWA